MTRKLPLLAILSLCACRADSGATAKPAPSAASTASSAHDIDRASMDTSVSPGDDFFRFANGAWLRNTEIPADRASYGVGDALEEQAQERTRGLLEAAASGNAAAGSDERKVGDDEYRADTVRNLDAWYPAFDVKKGRRLYLDPPDRVQVW